MLRTETTINDPRDFYVYRASENAPRGKKSWRILRRGVADLYRRAEICQAANRRYLDALAAEHMDWEPPSTFKRLRNSSKSPHPPNLLGSQNLSSSPCRRTQRKKSTAYP